MGNDFFNNHPIPGSLFDFDRDGSMSLGEAGAMGAFGAMWASEMMSASEEAEREAEASPWDDDDDDDGGVNYDSGAYGIGSLGGTRARSALDTLSSKSGPTHTSQKAGYEASMPKSLFDNDYTTYDLYGRRKSGAQTGLEDAYDYEDVNTSSRKSVMRAIDSGDYDGDIEDLVDEALGNGVRFKPEDIIDLSYLIWDQELLVELISTSKPRFLQEHADELSPRWGPVELEYHEDAFDEEYSEDGTYYVNTPEEDW